MAINSKAGTLAQSEDLIDLNRLVSLYYDIQPDCNDPTQHVVFGTSGHRGSSFKKNFTEQHIIAICQAIIDIRHDHQISGPCFIGKDTHALSEPAFKTVLEVLTANHIYVIIQENNGFTPTPAISHAILIYNQTHKEKADGIIITPSHNPPEDGGIKYNSFNGGPADTGLTTVIERKANAYLQKGLDQIKRQSITMAYKSDYLQKKDMVKDYIDDLVNVVDMPTIQKSGLKLAVDPLGGASIEYWQRISQQYQLDLTIVNEKIDPSFNFMHLDHDGVIRMDCSSPWVMSGLINLKESFDLAFANDPDADRHGIITQLGLMPPNPYLSTAINYLYQHRPDWASSVAVGKTLVSSGIIDKVVKKLERKLFEYPVGFKWFVDELYRGKLGFAGEESAGASFLRRNGQVWTTDKDGIILCLLGAEMMAKTGKNPQQHYLELEQEFGKSYYSRIQAPATLSEKKRLSQLNADMLTINTLAGDKILQTLTTAPANNAPIDGLKVVTQNGWFTARPSGTEEAYKVYSESFVSETHLKAIEEQAIDMIKSII